MTAPSRYKDWSPAAIFGGNSNDARVHPVATSAVNQHRGAPARKRPLWLQRGADAAATEATAS